MKLLLKITVPTIILISCIFVFIIYTITKPNVRWYLKNDIKFWALLNKDTAKKYVVLEIGSPENHFNPGLANFKFRLENGSYMESSNINFEVLQSLSYKRSNPNQYSNKWPEGSIMLHLQGYSFIIHDKKVLKFYAETFYEDQPKYNTPAIASNAVEHFYTFPLSEKEVIDVFGQPDKFHDFARY